VVLPIVDVGRVRLGNEVDRFHRPVEPTNNPAAGLRLDAERVHEHAFGHDPGVVAIERLLVAPCEQPCDFHPIPHCTSACGGPFSYQTLTISSSLLNALDVIVPRPPEQRQVPAEVQFEVAANTVTDIPELGTARLRIWQG